MRTITARLFLRDTRKTELRWRATFRVPRLFGGPAIGPFALMIILLACGMLGAANPPATATTHKRAAGTAPVMTDTAINASIKERLARSKIGKNGFKYKVSGGIVTWEGKTDVIQHKGAATRMAKSAGARAVVNNIQISDAAKAKAKANLESGRRRAQVTRSEPRSSAK